MKNTILKLTSSDRFIRTGYTQIQKVWIYKLKDLHFLHDEHKNWHFSII